MSLTETIAVLGTGDFGRALTKALLKGGYDVAVGSRHPTSRDLAKCDPALKDARVVSILEAIGSSNIVLLAMHPGEAQAKLKLLHEVLAGKIVVDVSNVEKKRGKVSNAEGLQQDLPKSFVVKAFNTLSAYTLMTGLSAGSLDVHVASDHGHATDAVMVMARRMGFHATNFGSLQSARELEAMPTRLFNGWGAPLIVSVFIFAFWMTYGTVRYHVIKDHEWSRVPMNTMNKAMGCSAITLLALCFLPGCFAAFAQLCYGTKHQRFQGWLDHWLKMRKQLGLIALWLACIHSVLSLAQLNPGYYAKWYGTSSVHLPGNNTENVDFKLSPRMSWIGECVVAFGTLALGLMCVLGVTSLPSVGSRLNWRQWTFVQSYLGHACLVLATVHVMLNATPKWGGTDFFLTVQKLSFLSLLIPLLTIFLRVVLLLPCFSVYIWKIRHGWERGQKSDDVELSRYDVCGDMNSAVVVDLHKHPELSQEVSLVAIADVVKDNPAFVRDVSTAA